jgi:pimeloyl-ACP methyl ester carboxylesterase
MDNWRYQVGHRRDWIWRGWITHYSYQRSQSKDPQAEPKAPLLLLHGFGGSIGHWRNNIPVLAQHHSLYALDLLGFGSSQKAIAPYGTDLWLEQVYDFWRTFIQEPVILVGHSIGSMICLALAVKYPEMVQGMVMFTLPDASVLGGPKWLRSKLVKGLTAIPLGLAKRLVTFPPLFVPLFRTIRKPGVLKSWAKGAYGQGTAVNDDLVDVFSSPAYNRGAARALMAMINAKPSGDYAAREVLPTIQVPMLLVWGKKDQAVPFSLAQKCLAYSDRIELLELDDIGHCAHDECPEVSNQAILSWIDSWGSRGANIGA